jgi:hypothetical protein
MWRCKPWAISTRRSWAARRSPQPNASRRQRQQVELRSITDMEVRHAVLNNKLKRLDALS